MSNFLNAIKITDKVYWVGAVDWGIKDFHGYATEHGTTYNAFLVLDRKITLIDTVKAPFFNEMLARISSVINPAEIDYIISNHSEMDHSGSLPMTLEAVKPEKVFASPMGKKNLKSHFSFNNDITEVKTGDEINTGSLTFSFIETKMLHWPDSMFSYLKEEKILFSQDAFGMHLAGDKIFEDEYDPYLIKRETSKYFANILMLYSDQIKKLLKALPGFNLDINIIAPDHGPLWRTKLDRILECYGKWSEQPPTDKAVIVYDTMWQSTAMMARSIADGVMKSGATATVLPLSSKNRSLAAVEILEAGALIVGSPTLNNNIFPTVADVLTYLKGLRPQNLTGAAFGSYGWSGEAVKQITEYLKTMRIETKSEPLKIKYVPDPEALAKCNSFGYNIGRMLLSKIK
jgi:flavorubredoxin